MPRLRRLGRSLVELSGDLTAQRASSRPIDGAVDDDAVQPGPERTAAIEAVERADGSDERLLGDVLGRRGIVHDEVRGPVRTRPVAAEKPPRRGLRPRLGLANPPA